MSSNYIEVKSKTWLKDSHGLFDYDATQTTKECLKIYSSGSIMRKGTEIWFNPEASSPKSGMLLKVYENEDHFLLCPVKDEQAGLIVKKVKSNTRHGFKLSKGDVIKLGRVKLKVKEIHSESVQEFDGDEFEGSINPETTCRICFRTHSNEIDPLTSVCRCSGSMELVHLLCLRRYLISKAIKKTYSNCISYLWKSIQCDVCKENLPLSLKFNDKVYETIIISNENLQNSITIEDYRRNKYKYILHVLTLKDSPFLVGRATDTDLKISDISVSRSHLTIDFHKNEYFIKDNGSKFGTIIVQKKPIQVSKQSSPVLQIGRSTLKFIYKTSVKPLRCLTACCQKMNKVDNFPKSRTEIVWEEESFRSSEHYEDDEEERR